MSEKSRPALEIGSGKLNMRRAMENVTCLLKLHDNQSDNDRKPVEYIAQYRAQSSAVGPPEYSVEDGPARVVEIIFRVATV